MNADGRLIGEIDEFAQQAGGWNRLAAEIHKLLPELVARQDPESSHPARERYYAER